MALVRHCHEVSVAAGGPPLTVTKPTSGSPGPSPKNVAAGDLLVIYCGNDSTSGTPEWDNSTNKPTGFTFINTAGDGTSDAHCAAFWRTADGTEGASFSLPAVTSTDIWAICVLYSGAAASPINAIGTDIIDGTPPIAITGVDTTVAGCIVSTIYAYDGGDDGGFSTSGTGWAEVVEARTGTASSNASGALSERVMSGTGASGTCTISVVSGDGMAGFQFAIAPLIGANQPDPIAATGAVLAPGVVGAAAANVDVDTQPGATGEVVDTDASISVNCYANLAAATGAVSDQHDVDVIAEVGATQENPVAATGAIPPATVTVSPGISGVKAEAAGAVPAHSTSVTGVIGAVLAQAAAVVLSVGLGTGVAAPVSTATADVLVPTVTISAGVEASVAAATGAIPEHPVTVGTGVGAALATAGAEALVPEVKVTAEIQGQLAAATGDVLVPTAGSGTGAQAVTVAATADVVDTDASISVNCYADEAAATGALPEHTVEAVTGAAAVVVEAAAAVPTPGVGVSASVSGSTAGATASSPGAGLAVGVQVCTAEAWAGAPSSPRAGLLAYYAFDIVGSEGGDSHDAQDLTKVGDISVDVGGIRGRYVNSLGGYLTRTTGAFNQTRDFTVAFWAKRYNADPPDGLLYFQSLAGYQIAVGIDAPWDDYNFIVQSAPASQRFVTIPRSTDTGVWDFVVARYRANTRIASLQKNADSPSYATPLPDPLRADATDVYCDKPTSSISREKLDELGIWNRYLTDEEIVYLYNSGVGRFYPYDAAEVSGDILIEGAAAAASAALPEHTVEGTGATVVEPPVITATAEVVDTDASISVVLYPPAAGATGAIPAPAVAMAGAVGGVVAAATGNISDTGAFISPTVTQDSAAGATASLPVPTLAQVATVEAVVLEATAGALVPGVTVSPGVGAATAAATGALPIPAVSGVPHVAAVRAIATAAIPVPVVQRHAYISPSSAAAVASPPRQLTDSFETSNGSGGLLSIVPARGQSFLGDGHSLLWAAFYMHRTGPATGTIRAYLFAHTGTFGVNGVPTGSPLAISTPIQAAGLNEDPPQWKEFFFPAPYLLEDGTPYFICLVGTDGISGAMVRYMGPGTHEGNATAYSGVWEAGNWNADGIGDYTFRVYTTISSAQVSTKGEVGAVAAGAAGALPQPSTVVAPLVEPSAAPAGAAVLAPSIGLTVEAVAAAAAGAVLPPGIGLPTTVEGLAAPATAGIPVPDVTGGVKAAAAAAQAQVLVPTLSVRTGVWAPPVRATARVPVPTLGYMIEVAAVPATAVASIPAGTEALAHYEEIVFLFAG